MAVSERESLRTTLPVVYDPTVLNLYFSIRPDKVLRRMILFFREIAALSFELARDRALSALDARRVAAGALTHSKRQQRQQQRQNTWAVHLRDAMTRLGPAVIKFGQAAATRQDLFTAPVIKELQKLQDAVLPFFPTLRAYQLIQQELQATPDYIFDHISPNPVAGASLGMVFKAKVEGVDVAVKVQRPEVAEQIAMDCYIVRYFATVANVLLRSRTDFAAAVDEYASHLFEELDYTNELKNMKKFRNAYGHVEGIYLPRVFEQYSSRRVLVTEWVEGVKLIDDEAKVKAEDIPLVENGIRFALMQLLDKGYMHADMHNGNMLKTKSGYLAYIDFGLISEIPASVRESLVCALMHLIHGEYTYLAETFVGLAVMRSDDVEIELPLLSEALRDALEPPNTDFTDDEAGELERLRRFTLVGIVGKLLTLGNRFPFVFGDYFLTNLRCLGMLEGLALNADPRFSILGVVYPFVVRKILTDPSPRFRRALESLVIDSYGRMRWTRMGQLLHDVEATAASTSFLFDESSSMSFGSRGKDDKPRPLPLSSRQSQRITRIGNAEDGTFTESKITKTSTPSPDLILQFITSKSGRFLREYIINKTTNSMKLEWTARIDKLFGTADVVLANSAGNGTDYDPLMMPDRRIALQTTDREISDEATRKRTRMFFRRSPFWKRCRVLLRLAPGFFIPLLNTLLHISLYFLSKSVQAIRGKRKRIVVPVGSAVPLNVVEEPDLVASGDAGSGGWPASQAASQTWKPFDSGFLRRSAVNKSSQSTRATEFTRGKVP
eukprot:gb/GEZJ01000236.1/.p1 GENE.gb/GEZJ01000236.1/~~gb/GEZJ01000236.1/.p1  ORF type:complete len:896 (-),score=160.10 gb/GEZJ01000236.1/:1458-3800(-)